MKKTFIALSLVTVLLTSGCGLIPKRVEFFQDKVHAVPQVTEKEKEHQKQAAKYIADQLEAAKTVSIEHGVDPSLITLVDDAASVSHSLSTSLGPPLSPWLDTSTNLVDSLNRDGAKHQEALDKYAKDIQKDVGHKIEGTGLFSFSYFTYVGLFIGLILLVWFGLKIYGSINPAVGLGVNTVSSVASSVLSKGFSEVVAGGEAFKTYLSNSNLSTDVKNYVSSLFVQAHTANQSADVQKLVDTLTNNPSTIVAPPIAPVPAPTLANVSAPAPVIPANVMNTPTA